MKYDLFDLFSEYEGELPETKEKSCDTERIRQLVTEKTPKIDAGPQRAIISAGKSIDTDSEYSYEVRGVDIYMKSKWKKPAVVAAASLILAGGVFGGAALLKKSGGKNSSSDSYYASVDSTGGEGTTAFEKKEKITVTVAFVGGIYNPAQYVNMFNYSQDEYTVRIVDYDKYRDENDPNSDAPLQQLKLDIVSGDAPDVIAVCDNGLMKNLELKGTFANLYDFMENDPEVNRDALMPNVLRALENKDGNLYRIAPTFWVGTMAVKEKFGQNENWSFDDMIDFFDNAPATADHVYDTHERDDMFETMLYGMDELIDYDNAKCYFDSDDFVRMLEFCNRFPEKLEKPSELDTGALGEYWYDRETWLKKDRELFKFFSVSGGNNAYLRSNGIITAVDVMSNMKYLYFGDDITLVGYPSDNGSGGRLTLDGNQFAILNSSKVKDGAWQFVRSFLTKETQTYYRDPKQHDFDNIVTSFSVRKDCFDNQMDFLKNIWEWDEWKQEYVVTDKFEYEGTTVYPLSDEEYTKLREYVTSCDTIYGNIDEDIISICKEEADAYFHGDCTAIQAADRIQSRCSILLSENS